MRISLKTKMILAFSSVAIISIASIVIYANIDSERQVRNYLNQGGMYGMTTMVNRLEEYYQTEGTWEGMDMSSGMGQMIGRGNNPRSSSKFTLVNTDFQVVWSSLDEYIVGDVLTQSDVKNSLLIKDSSDKVAGYLIVEGASNVTIDDITPFVSRLRDILLIAGVATAIVAVLLAILIANQMLKPVKALTTASSKLSAGDLATRVEVNGNDELAVLGKTFNLMAENLESLEERKRSLTADIAHELRTPLAVQRAQIEAMVDGVIPLDNENLKIIADQADFLSRMVDDLRLLAMADAGELKLDVQELQIDDLLRKIVESFKGKAQQEGTDLSFTVMENARGQRAAVDPDRFTQIIHNLLTNAMRYGKKGGRVEIELKYENHHLLVSVKDDGQGIPESALPHLFERFYRHERARNRETGGTGLGLAISKKLALIMGGDLTAANDPRGGAVFTLVLPDSISRSID